MSVKCLLSAAIASFGLAAMFGFMVSISFNVIVPVFAVNTVALTLFSILGFSMHKESLV